MQLLSFAKSDTYQAINEAEALNNNEIKGHGSGGCKRRQQAGFTHSAYVTLDPTKKAPPAAACATQQLAR
jgi:hypothetical protein